MQLRYVASELGTGIKRNVTMTLAVILTIWISLTLVGLGLLMRSQVATIEQYVGGELEVRISFCNRNSQPAQCIGGQATKRQEQAVEEAIASSDDVASYRYITRAEFFEGFKKTNVDESGRPDPIASQVTLADMPSQYSVRFKDPDQTKALTRELENMPGVEGVIDLRERLAPVYDVLNALQWLALGGAGLLVTAAVLQVSNTIRLAAMARRREIGIMRLVGASSVYIQLPFVLEVVFSALVGAALACGSLAAVMTLAVPKLRGQAGFWPWVEWDAAVFAMGSIVAIAVALAVVPTLLMTRKYLRV